MWCHSTYCDVTVHIVMSQYPIVMSQYPMVVLHYPIVMSQYPFVMLYYISHYPRWCHMLIKHYPIILHYPIVMSHYLWCHTTHGDVILPYVMSYYLMLLSYCLYGDVPFPCDVILPYAVVILPIWWCPLSLWCHTTLCSCHTAYMVMPPFPVMSYYRMLLSYCLYGDAPFPCDIILPISSCHTAYMVMSPFPVMSYYP